MFTPASFVYGKLPAEGALPSIIPRKSLIKMRHDETVYITIRKGLEVSSYVQYVYGAPSQILCNRSFRSGACTQ